MPSRSARAGESSGSSSDELRPTAATTVLDVGVDEVGFGAEGGQSGCGTHNFFEELYPWRDRITGARAPRRSRLPRELPDDPLRAG